MSDPQRPVGVYMIAPNGDTTPIELAYAGFQDDVHVWDCITPLIPGGRLHVSLFPAHTSIRLPVEE